MKDKSRLLVLDDDANLRKTLADILRIKGYEVAVAGTGAEGVAEASRTFVNVALIDLKLPDISGIEVMERIKLAAPLTEAIILTGHAALDTAIDATNKGAFSYLLKPYEIDDLLQHIRRAVERQQAQQNTLRLSSFLLSSPNPIFEADASGQITYSNPATQALFPDLVSMGGRHPLLAGLTDVFAVFREGKQREIVRQASVEDRAFELRMWFVADSNRILIYAVDISERLRAENALRESEQRFRAIIENVRDGILLADVKEDRFVYGNPGICEMLGYSQPDITKLGRADVHPEKDWPRIRKQIEEQSGKGTMQEIPVRRKDGSIFPADIHSFPVTLQGKEYLVAFFREATKRTD